MIQVTHHAALRYQERVAACGIGDARRRIREHDRVLQIATDFGAPVVKLSDGTRFVLKGGAVGTVLGAGMPVGPVA